MEIVAADHQSASELLGEDIFREHHGPEHRKLTGKGAANNNVDTQFLELLDLLVPCRKSIGTLSALLMHSDIKSSRCVIVHINDKHNSLKILLCGLFLKNVDQVTMSAVYAVKFADSNGRVLKIHIRICINLQN